VLLGAGLSSAALAAAVDRRTAGVPLEHLLGWADFCGLRIVVAAGVFVPRSRTELLVRSAAAAVRRAAARRDSAPVAVDLCCGSGAVGAAVAATVESVDLYAVDIDATAVACARQNLVDAGAQVLQGDLYDPLPPRLRGTVDVLVANAPYVPTEEIRLMPPEARLHEARTALDGGVDGLHVQSRVAAGAAHWLAPGGRVLVETSARQAPQTAELCADAGLVPRVVHSQRLAATVVIGRLPRR